MNMSEKADQHYVRGQQLLTMADALIMQAVTETVAHSRAHALASVAQGHFHAAMAATTISTQRSLLNMASGDVQAVQEASSGPADSNLFGADHAPEYGHGDEDCAWPDEACIGHPPRTTEA